VPAGRYTVRLTVEGTRYDQPLVVHMDPRVKTGAADLARLASLSRSLYDEAVRVFAASTAARALSAELARQGGTDGAMLKASLDSLLPPTTAGGRGFGGGRGSGAPAQPTLEGASTALLAAAMGMQTADVAPTARDAAAAAAARAQASGAMTRWTTLSTSRLAALNAKRRAAGQPPITVPK
jgi:hypothetical protein